MFITILALYFIANCWIFYSAWPHIQPLPMALKLLVTLAQIQNSGFETLSELLGASCKKV